MKSTRDLQFMPILQTSEDVQVSVRDMRNLPDIRKVMYSDHVITPEEHRQWLSSLKDNETSQVFVIFRDHVSVGIVSLTRISRQHGTADWAFYLVPQAQGGGVGVVVEVALLDYAFDELKLQKLNCEVLETNPQVIKLHCKFGFVEEGVRRANILKDGVRINVHLLGITADEWQKHRPRLVRVLERQRDAGLMTEG